MSTLITILLVGLLIAFHELGHFLLAKLAGVKVFRFSIGFGPRLCAHRRGETEYQLSLIPLGGYVQLLNDPPKDPRQAERDRGRSMAEKSAGWKALIFAAGPCANLVLPFLLLPCVYLLGIEVPAYRLGPPVVGYVASGSAAERAGVMAGDTVVRADGDGISSWMELDEKLAQASEAPLLMQLRRHERSLWLEVIRADRQDSRLGFAPPLEAVLGVVYPQTPAALAGLEAGDRIVGVNGREVFNWYDFTSAIETSQGRSLFLKVERQGDIQEIEVVPELEGDGYKVGVSVAQEMILQQHDLPEALRLGTERGGEMIGMIFTFLGNLFRGEVAAEQIGGPVAVFKMTGEAVQTSWADTLFVLAFLSIQLGLLNLLPIPVLDGGQLLFLLPEMVVRRPLPDRLREGLQGVGLVMVLSLMALAFYNDITRLFQ